MSIENQTHDKQYMFTCMTIIDQKYASFKLESVQTYCENSMYFLKLRLGIWDFLASTENIFLWLRGNRTTGQYVASDGGSERKYFFM